MSQRLGELLGAPVAFAGDTVGDSARSTVDGLADGEVALLENLRFNPRETSKDDAERGAFADQLAALADAFVTDGFGVVHRKQASVVDVAERLPHAAGGLVLTEVDVLKRLTSDAERPYVVVLGGSKVSDKLGVIENLLGTADRILVGGGMVFTFLKAQGHEVGKSLLEDDQLDTVRGYLETAAGSGASRSCCRRTSSRRPRSRPTPSTTSWPPTPSPRTGSGSTSARSPASCSPASWPTPGRSSGTARWGCSSWSRSATARVPWPRRWSTREAFTVVGGGDSAAAVRTLGFDEAGLRPHLHRWWREPGVPRGQDPPRPDRARQLREAPLMARGTVTGRVPLMAGNWKMNLDHLAGAHLVQKLDWTLKDGKHDFAAVEVAVLPPFTDLRTVQTLVDADKLDIRYGGQDLSPHADGAYTGDISGRCWPTWAARTSWSGTASAARSTTRTTPWSTRRSGRPTSTGSRRSCASVRGWRSARPASTARTRWRSSTPRWTGLTAAQGTTLVVAYEPVWAIGTGEVATPEDAQEVCGAIRTRLAEIWSGDVADAVRVLYGGSVKSTNVASIMAQPDVDGALVGGASLKADEFASICRYRDHQTG